MSSSSRKTSRQTWLCVILLGCALSMYVLYAVGKENNKELRKYSPQKSAPIDVRVVD